MGGNVCPFAEFIHSADFPSEHKLHPRGSESTFGVVITALRRGINEIAEDLFLISRIVPPSVIAAAGRM